VGGRVIYRRSARWMLHEENGGKDSSGFTISEAEKMNEFLIIKTKG